MTNRSTVPPERRAEVAERRKRVLAARLRGESFRAIADREDIAVSTAHQDYQTALSDIPKPEAEQLRKVEGERLDMLQKGVWDAAILGDIDASRQALRIIDRRAKLFGLDAPQKVDVSTGNVDLDATVAKILQVAEIAVRGQDGKSDG